MVWQYLGSIHVASCQSVLKFKKYNTIWLKYTEIKTSSYFPSQNKSQTQWHWFDSKSFPTAPLPLRQMTCHLVSSAGVALGVRSIQDSTGSGGGFRWYGNLWEARLHSFKKIQALGVAKNIQYILCLMDPYDISMIHDELWEIWQESFPFALLRKTKAPERCKFGLRTGSTPCSFHHGWKKSHGPTEKTSFHRKCRPLAKWKTF